MQKGSNWLVKVAGIGLLSMGALSLATPAPALDAACATLYQHSGYGGERKNVNAGARVSNIGSLWNDQVSSVRVRSGCTLDVWQHDKFRGEHTSFTASVPFVGSFWNDKITSYTCTCR